MASCALRADLGVWKERPRAWKRSSWLESAELIFLRPQYEEFSSAVRNVLLRGSGLNSKRVLYIAQQAQPSASLENWLITIAYVNILDELRFRRIA